MNLKLTTFLATLAMVGFISSAAAIDDALKKGDSPGAAKQKAKEIESTEAELDKKIQKLNDKLAVYYRLQDVKIKYTPGQTRFDKGDGYIELRSYDFIPLGYSNKSVGHREKWLKLYFDDNNQLTKVETLIERFNFREQTSFKSRVVDPSPKTEGTEDIQIRTKVNLDDTYDVTLSKMENTVTNPLRLKFKREYYIPHLKYFEKLFRFTQEYQKRYGTNNDAVTIDTLKKSLLY